MNIAIYQIDPDRDENNVAFLNYENLERFQALPNFVARSTIRCSRARWNAVPWKKCTRCSTLTIRTDTGAGPFPFRMWLRS